MNTAPRTYREHAPASPCCSRGEHHPLTDDLTGLLVRGAWEIRASQALASARRQHRPVALILGDLDRFKGVNDTYGHLAGDAVLRATADVLHRTEGVIGGRYGGHAGDEFLALLPDTTAGEALAVARHIQRAVREMSVPAPVSRGTTVTLTGQTISLGIAVWDPVDPAPGGLSDLILDSDVALREVKRAGGNRIRLAGSPTTVGHRPVHETSPAIRPHWLPYGGTHRAVPAGTWWDAVRMPGPLGHRVLETLRRHGDGPPGPVIAHPRGGPGEPVPQAPGGPGAQSRLYFLVPPRTVGRWEVPGTRALGHGSYVVVPDADSVRPPGLHWLIPPAPDRRLTPLRSLCEALESLGALESPPAPEPAGLAGLAGAAEPLGPGTPFH
ncbi:MAG TPA: GGDEF domain-containing protein [Streptomyces sp.]|nr:GGDEF domain-containing protein [Streptomyces sp.]